MTSGTSGCNISGFVQNDNRLGLFAEANMTDLDGDGTEKAIDSRLCPDFWLSADSIPAFGQMTASSFQHWCHRRRRAEQLVGLVRSGIQADAGLSEAFRITRGVREKENYE